MDAIKKPIRMARANCPICGAEMTKRGLVGHMRFLHGRDNKAPLLEVERPERIADLRVKARLWDQVLELSDGTRSPCQIMQAVAELPGSGLSFSDDTVSRHVDPHRDDKTVYVTLGGKVIGKVRLTREPLPGQPRTAVNFVVRNAALADGK